MKTVIDLFACVGFFVVAARLFLAFTSPTSTNIFVALIRKLATGVENIETKTDKTS